MPKKLPRLDHVQLARYREIRRKLMRGDAYNPDCGKWGLAVIAIREAREVYKAMERENREYLKQWQELIHSANLSNGEMIGPENIGMMVTPLANTAHTAKDWYFLQKLQCRLVSISENGYVIEADNHPAITRGATRHRQNALRGLRMTFSMVSPAQYPEVAEVSAQERRRAHTQRRAVSVCQVFGLNAVLNSQGALWISGNTYPAREDLRGVGAKWSHRWKAWTVSSEHTVVSGECRVVSKAA